MDVILRITPLITTGNLLVVGTIIGTGITIYWALRRKWFDMELAYRTHVQEALAQQTQAVKEITEVQTERLENCIHKVPGHPEPGQDSTAEP